jgi:hypothetical protein
MDIKSPTKDERIALHYRGIKMILVTLFLGVLAGLLSSPYILSQPVYAPFMEKGGSDYMTYPSIALHNAAIITPNTAAPAGSFTMPDAAAILENSSRLYSNVTFLTPGANVAYKNVVITPATASFSKSNDSIVMSHATIQLANTSDVPADSPVLLSNGIVMMSSPTDTQNATILMGPITARQTNPHTPNNSSLGFLILALLIYVQKFIFPYLGIDSKRFGFKTGSSCPS